MKLSEAILLGSIGTEQGRGGPSLYMEGEGKCALGAALKAIGLEFSWDDGMMPPYTAIKEAWPLTETVVDHPCLSFRDRVTGVIIDLNDNHGWTRPQIAAWVASLEATLLGPNEVSAQEQAKTETVHVPEPESVNII